MNAIGPLSVQCSRGRRWLLDERRNRVHSDGMFKRKEQGIRREGSHRARDVRLPSDHQLALTKD